ncbi:MAG: hypothetical protein ACMXYM_01790 [Candidatus Woesearchaeota archaeon]
MEGFGDDADASPSDLLREITELKRSNQRLERAFVALSQILENQQSILNSIAPQGVQTHPHDTLRKEFERKLKRGRASIVKEKILAHLERAGTVELSELKFLFVDQLSYTSKASFYRYVSDLSKSGAIAESDVNGQTYLSLGRIERTH